MSENYLATPLPNGPRYLTLQQAVAEGYGAYVTLLSWIRQGKLPAYKMGGRVKVRREDLEALCVPVGGNPVDAAIEKLVAAAPHLSDEQTRRLRELLGGERRVTFVGIGRLALAVLRLFTSLLRVGGLVWRLEYMFGIGPFFGWAWASFTWVSLWWQKIMIPLGTIGAAVAFVLFVLRVAQWVHDELG